MRSKQSKKSSPGFSRREFLLTVGATAPTISLMESEARGVPRPSPGPEAGDASGKFTPLKLSAYFNSSAQEFGPRDKAALIGGDSAKDSLIRVPGGMRDMQGIPFILGPEDLQSKSWIVLRTKSGPNANPAVEIPVVQKAHFLCLTSFCDFDENEDPEPGKDVFQKVGQRLADVTLIYEDNGTHVLPIRRRFETNAVLEPWGHLCFNALPQGKLRAVKLNDPLRSATGWGNLQTTIGGNNAGGPGLGTVSVCALENPEPDRTIRGVRIEAAGEDALVVCGLTLYHRAGNPLRLPAKPVCVVATLRRRGRGPWYGGGCVPHSGAGGCGGGSRAGAARQPDRPDSSLAS